MIYGKLNYQMKKFLRGHSAGTTYVQVDIPCEINERGESGVRQLLVRNLVDRDGNIHPDIYKVKVCILTQRNLVGHELDYYGRRARRIATRFIPMRVNIKTKKVYARVGPTTTWSGFMALDPMWGSQRNDALATILAYTQNASQMLKEKS